MAPELMTVGLEDVRASDMWTLGSIHCHASKYSHACACFRNQDRVDSDATKCDVFSFAVLALFVATGTVPHCGLSNQQIFVKVRYLHLGGI